MGKVHLTHRFVDSPQRVPQAGRRDYADSLVPGLALRVTSNGHRSFVLVARYPLHPKNPTRRALGDYGAITLEQARDRARNWLALIEKGVDPKVQEARERAAERRKQANTFASVATDFLEQEVIGPSNVLLERQAKELQQEVDDLSSAEALARIQSMPTNRALVLKGRREGIAKRSDAENTIKTEFVKRWGAWPIVDITQDECAAAIKAIVKRGSPYQAHNAFGYLRRLFNWAIGTGTYGITASPLERIRPADLIGKREARERILSDDELRAVWNKTGGSLNADILKEARRRDQPPDKTSPMGYPYGPLIRMMILTGQRESEIAEMTWAEVDFDKKLWTIPADRMKGGRTHEVPLAPDALALLASLPRFVSGDHVFTTTGGAKPINGFSKAKQRIDTLSGVKDWKFHDLRRTMRTHLSALPVQDLVRELVIAHAKPGLHRVYDQHAYQEEKRECIELWEARLRLLISRGGSGDV